VAVTDLGSRWACQVDVLDSGTVEVAIGILRFGKRWDLAGRLDLTYDHAPAAAEGDESTGGQVAVAPIALHASVPHDRRSPASCAPTVRSTRSAR
jgi:hypothetical protein